MKTVLRRISSGLYFRAPDTWTSDPRDAKDFKMIDRALWFIEKWALDDVEVVFAFQDRRAVTRVPREKLSMEYQQS